MNPQIIEVHDSTNRTAPPAATRASERLLIFDTSLRDGEQAPGFSMTQAQKLTLAQALAELGVDVIEAGFPQASTGDFEAVREIARRVRSTRICALARCQAADIEIAARALESAAQPRVHVFIATSPIHRLHKLNMSREQVVEAAVRAVSHARRFFTDVEFSAEDALRSEPEFLVEIFSEVIAAGATTLNVPDTVGYTTPSEMATLIAYLKREVRGIERATISVHCHDDLGMAVANSLAAAHAGARQIECTINGIGERAGNCALEEVVMALHTRTDHFGLSTGVDTTRLYPTSRLLASVVGASVPRNKAVVGENAFAHEAGIHQHGMLKHRSTYEIMRPEDVGFARTNLVLGKHSGRHALRERIEFLGLRVDDGQLDEVFTRFKTLADKKKEVFDRDIEALALGLDPDAQGPWRIESLHANSHVGGVASASVRLRRDDGVVISEAAAGDGPVHAVLRALERATACNLELSDFQIRSVSVGSDAQGQATVSVTHEGREYRGRGISTDVIEAAALAFLDIINRICRSSELLAPQALASTA
jgi:2-isopropylmalate synthase